jgi:L-rhamnonate dehydratase
MRIVDLRVDVVRHPAFPDRVGRRFGIAIVRVLTDEGIVGIGEASTAPEVVRAIVDAPAFGVLAHGIRDVLVGRDPREIVAIWEDLYRLTLYCGHRGAYLHAISAIDIALWDILGKATGLPVHTLLGGAFQRELPAYRTELMPDTASEVAAVVERAISEGWSAVKLGWLPHPSTPARDAELVRAARTTAGPDATLMIDVGGRWEARDGVPRAVASWDVKTAIRRIRAWESAGLAWVEEPLPADDLEGYRRLADAVPTPIAAGEQETTRFGICALLDAGVDVIQCDVARVGGLTEGRRVVQAAADRNRAFAPHCYGSDLQLVASAHLAAAAPTLARLEYPAALDGPPLVYPPLKPRGDAVAISDAPGLGVELDEELVDRLSIAANDEGAR